MESILPLQANADKSLHLNQLITFLNDLFCKSGKVPVRMRVFHFERKQSAGGRHYYTMSLCDLSNEKRTVRVSGFAWPSAIEPFLQQTGREKLEDGIEILATVEPRVHDVFGFSMGLKSISGEFEAGREEQRKRDIIGRAINDGIIDHNRKLEIPEKLQRIAVISSRQAQGFGDFWSKVSGMQDAGICHIQLHEVRFGCDGAAAEIARVIEDLQGRVDLICIVRGGGDAAGIATLNEESLVRAVCKSDVPVLVGIGHQQDRTLLDEVAWCSAITPTDAAMQLKRTIRDNRLRATASLVYDIIRAGRESVRQYRTQLDAFEQELLGELSSALRDRERLSAVEQERQRQADERSAMEHEVTRARKRMRLIAVVALGALLAAGLLAALYLNT